MDKNSDGKVHCGEFVSGPLLFDSDAESQKMFYKGSLLRDSTRGFCLEELLPFTLVLCLTDLRWPRFRTSWKANVAWIPESRFAIAMHAMTIHIAVWITAKYLI